MGQYEASRSLDSGKSSLRARGSPPVRVFVGQPTKSNKTKLANEGITESPYLTPATTLLANESFAEQMKKLLNQITDLRT